MAEQRGTQREELYGMARSHWGYRSYDGLKWADTKSNLRQALERVFPEIKDMKRGPRTALLSALAAGATLDGEGRLVMPEEVRRELESVPAMTHLLKPENMERFVSDRHTPGELSFMARHHRRRNLRKSPPIRRGRRDVRRRRGGRGPKRR